MRTVVFLDLDDTLFQTRPKCPPGEPLHAAALARDGEPLSFSTQRQLALLDLFAGATVIPTTARNRDAFRRVTLPFTSFAILDFGGVVLLPDGTLDPVWDAQVRPQAHALAAQLRDLAEFLQRASNDRELGVNVRLIGDFDLPLYVCAKHPKGDTAALDVLARVKYPLGPYFGHLNDNNLSFVPRFLGKERAVRHILEHHFADTPVLTLGVGDSTTDASYLRLCDFAMMPLHSQLGRQLPGGQA